MLNRRFTPYLVVVGLITLLLVCHISYREYQKHIAFERFISGAEAFHRVVAHTDQDGAHPHGGGNPDLNQAGGSPEPLLQGKTGR